VRKLTMKVKELGPVMDISIRDIRLYRLSAQNGEGVRLME